MPSNTPATDTDTVLSVLHHPVRRWVMQSVAEQTTTDLSTLTDTCIASDDPATGENHKRVYLSLQHVHLPALADAGLIQYDNQDGEIENDAAASARIAAAINELEDVRKSFRQGDNC